MRRCGLGEFSLLDDSPRTNPPNQDGPNGPGPVRQGVPRKGSCECFCLPHLGRIGRRGTHTHCWVSTYFYPLMPPKGDEDAPSGGGGLSAMSGISGVLLLFSMASIVSTAVPLVRHRFWYVPLLCLALAIIVLRCVGLLIVGTVILVESVGAAAVLRRWHNLHDELTVTPVAKGHPLPDVRTAVFEALVSNTGIYALAVLACGCGTLFIGAAWLSGVVVPMLNTVRTFRVDTAPPVPHVAPLEGGLVPRKPRRRA